MKQADDRPPPRIKSKKPRISVPVPVEEVDEPISMDLVESDQGSPLAYFTNTEHPQYAHDHSRRPAISRSIARASEIDFDQIPSPRSHLPVRPSTNGRDSSTLSKSFVVREPTPDPDVDYENPGAFDDYEPPQPDEGPPGATPDYEREEEAEEAEEVEEAVVPQMSRADKGKRRADPVEADDELNDNANGLEDDIERGLERVENAPDGEDSEPPAKKPRKEAAKSKNPRPERKKRVVQTPVERSPTPDGVRRGRRHRFKPLDWWRQEKVVYGRRDPDGAILVPQIKEIIRIPQEPIRPLGKVGSKRKRGAVARGKSKGEDTPFNSEEGWDENTPTNATVIDYNTQTEVSRPGRKQRLVLPKDFWGGRVHCGWTNTHSSGSQKPSKSTKDNTYVFYVIQGAVSVFIHETSFIITTGGMFLVPRGNTYYIQNIAERDAKLFFTQARMLPADIIQAQHTAQSAPPSSHRRAISEDTSTVVKKGGRKG
ncbi:Mif2/CENP-C like-domain-containing protein [Chiua virens]|nr:Mif2/CENP-C like-domain-containing protein [Chiua virens]